MNRTATNQSKDNDYQSKNGSRFKGKSESSPQLSEQQISRYTNLTAAVVIGAFILVHLIIPKFAQMTSYHDFADNRKVVGIPYFFNVISNLPFIWVGLQGMNLLSSGTLTGIDSTEKRLFNVFFYFVFFGGIGSAFYHLIPNNFTLLFDRLPITAAGMSLLSAIIADRISKSLGHQLLFPLLLFGILSTLYWEFSELIGAGDIRAYAFAQFLPAILIPLILAKMPKSYSGTHYLWNLVLCFGIARFGEFADGLFYMLSFHLISGHVVKHLALSWGVYQVYEYLKNRKSTNQ
uniref:Alkaline ceramidase n=1 Tax=Panagrolaimus superbus TaxID=310955 RepID=A0A914Y417_9BILA